ncbi:MAG: lamin tail domain-containing protein [Clostridiales bacterium]|nr:lamin tail domain-containing protein [Clostridiales bacterium]
MYSNRMKNTSPPRRKHSAIKRVKPPRGTLPLLLALCAAVVLLILFAPKIGQSPAANVSGTEVEASAVSSGNTNLRITEAMSSNRSAFPDETGAFPDWVELTNTGSDPINLKGYGLSDRADKITFVFPDITLAAGEHVIVFASDSTQNEAGKTLHAKFKLSSAGDKLFLFGSDGIAFQELDIPAMDYNMSYTWVGGNDYIITDQYTPGYDNTQEGYAAFRASTVLQSGALVINEICASSITTLKDEDGDYPDWIEIHNTTNQTIDLSNYALSDSTDKLVKWRFPQGSTIAPNGYFVVFASKKDRAAAEGSWPHANFKLRSNGETVILSDIQGRMVDMVTYDLLSADTSWGRDEEGDGSFKVFTSPTPGLPNTRAGMTAMDTALCLANTSGLYITEVMTGNKSIHGPNVTYFYDYIEIYNMSGQAVNLKGYGLSDNIKKPRKWQFPDITIENNSYLVIYCDTTQTTKDGVYYFTNFNLKKSGETVCLSTPTGEILDKIVVPQLYDDTSYGRTLGQAGLFYYSAPTPGTENGLGFTGYAEAPTFNVAGGLYERPLTGENAVTISVPANSVVRYTLDSTDPNETSPLYTGPIEVERNTVIRARAFRDGVEASQIISQTYLISVYHTMPVICLTTDPDNLWNEEYGALADGPNIDKSTSTPWFKNATYGQKNWFPAWLEYTDENGQLQISQGVRFRIMGQYSLDMPQKSMFIKADGQFGKSEFDYALFDDRPYTTYKSFVLRNGGQDGLYTRVMDGLEARIIDQADSTLVTQSWKPVIVYIDGEYWGHFNMRERAGVDMIAQHEGWANADDIDLLQSDGLKSTQVKQGSNADYKDLYNRVLNANLNDDPELLAEVEANFDIDNMFDYYIFESFYGNSDPGNVRFYRNTKSGDGKWRYLVFDMDWGLFSATYTEKGKEYARAGVSYYMNESGAGTHHIKSTLFLRRLVQVPKYRDKFLKRYGELFNTVLTTENMVSLFYEMTAQIKPEMQMHSERWATEMPAQVSFDVPKNATGAYNYWITRCERAVRVMNRRPHFIWLDIQSFFGLSDAEMESYFGPCPEIPAEYQ